jgi:PIN domain nuclease of toxin-antitoxin system
LAFYRNQLNLRLLFKNQSNLKLTSVFKWLDISELKMPKLVDLCAVSAWEILVKYLLGKLSISGSPECFIREQREQHDIDTLPLDEVSALHLPVLPKLHRDPFDRMLVCQAIEHNLTILTPDPMITQYPIKVIW